jgi:hypothetical protein
MAYRAACIALACAVPMAELVITNHAEQPTGSVQFRRVCAIFLPSEYLTHDSPAKIRQSTCRIEHVGRDHVVGKRRLHMPER